MTDTAAYQKGYRAGKAAVERAERDLDRQDRENAMWRQVFCAALTGTLEKGTWSTNNKTWTSTTNYVKGCANFASIAVKEFGGRA